MSPNDWYKDAIVYELHVRAFCDSNRDGIGDFKGLTQKLDYLAELGVTAVWLLPFYPSPLRDDGYDIADYTAIHPDYGTLKDFKRFLAAAHQRGLRVITELVLNHTSVDHAWFQRARRAPPNSRYRDYYVWSDNPHKYAEARIIFKDFETSNWCWDATAQAYFWHRFYSHQPDLNYDNPLVHQAMLGVLDFWLELGVDGLRLDAVPYLYEREGTACENLQETHAFLRKLRRHVDDRYPGRMLLGEANQWSEDAVAYFGAGDECHMNFHFPLMPRLFMALQLEEATPIVEVLRHTPAIPDGCQWATFLRNHDELTLEMVTDEEREFMYRVYAGEARARINLGIRRRLAPLLRLRRKVELLHGLLLSLPGTPVLYYGDELGMGDNIYLGDRNGVRTPMQWHSGRNAGFSEANPQKLYLPPVTDPEYHYQAINVEAQHDNPSSLLAWLRRVIGIRKRHAVFSRGSIEFVATNNPRLLAFLRRYQGEEVLVVANLSRYMQYGQLELPGHEGKSPVEMFGHNAFPPITNQPYFLSLGPHGFCWFTLEQESRASLPETPTTMEVSGDWRQVLAESSRFFEESVPRYLSAQRWFGGKSRRIRRVSRFDVIPIPGCGVEILLLNVEFRQGPAERYVLPLAYAEMDDSTGSTESEWPFPVVEHLTRVRSDGTRHPGVLYDAATSPTYCQALLGMMRRRSTQPGRHGLLRPHACRGLRAIPESELNALVLRPIPGEQSNTSVFCGNRFVLKFLRKVQEGISPELEMSAFLTETSPFPGTPDLAGSLIVRTASGSTAAFALLTSQVDNQGDGWKLTLRELDAFVTRALELGRPPSNSELWLGHTSDGTAASLPPVLGNYAQLVRRLAERTAELHRALAVEGSSTDFAPEDFTTLYRRSLYESIRTRLSHTMDLLHRQLSGLSSDSQVLARLVLQRKDELEATLYRLVTTRVEAQRIRCHGDYHLGQVLFTGTDFVIVDFEGEPARPFADRRFKRSALLDVAGMLRSFHYAVMTTRLFSAKASPQAQELIVSWLDVWHRWIRHIYLTAYRDSVKGTRLVPWDQPGFDTMLGFLLTEKCLYEVGYELDHRPDWVKIPLYGLLDLLDTQASVSLT